MISPKLAVSSLGPSLAVLLVLCVAAATWQASSTPAQVDGDAPHVECFSGERAEVLPSPAQETDKSRGFESGWDIGAKSPVELAPPDYAQYEASGLAHLVVREGVEDSATPAASSTVRVRMLGWSSNGQPLKGLNALSVTPYEFQLDSMIPGFSQSVQRMQAGEKRRIWIPEELAYRGAEGRPAGTLVFDVELVSFR